MAEPQRAGGGGHRAGRDAIARRLFLSPTTVRKRVSDVLGKLQARRRAEAVALARDAGLGGPGPGRAG
ncbi:LuxR C-terminal-related transcriptional regulator [Nocardioides sp.]|uniref:LuxR C-terminal-related transcriptional regulator n=1 Tax=Nocardioides sp. TaxID=35761 RepID=UPI0035659900